SYLSEPCSQRQLAPAGRPCDPPILLLGRENRGTESMKQSTGMFSTLPATARTAGIALLVLTAASCGFPRPPDLGNETIDGGTGTGNDDASVDAAGPSQFLSCSSLEATCGAGGDD